MIYKAIFPVGTVMPLAFYFAEVDSATPGGITAAFIGAFTVLIGLLVWIIKEDRSSLKSLSAAVANNQSTLIEHGKTMTSMMGSMMRQQEITKEMYQVLLAINDNFQPIHKPHKRPRIQLPGEGEDSGNG